ncbi:MAG: hypothetical protein CMB80_27045 [Flammeovirgaceae bacterium]|nr:hypothetical protein [Flammeovirgaceae bacterium]MBR11042.1 hypothetical protein [Rickettsiales bacterium]|tara:strand:- start:751 stop:1659 length:909 start_codon:yes stop_codon:yes gene_type:complete
MNKSLRFTLNLLVSALFLSALVSCGGGSSKSSADEVAFEEAEKKIVTDMDQVIHDLPSPTEVPYMLQATGADFNSDIINSLDNLQKYLTNEDESALNLGIYATDMGYLISYKQLEEATDYLESAQKLAESLGVASVFSVATVEKFQNNLDDPDSLNKILTQSITDVEDRLESADRVSVAALILSGSFIEGLYLAIEVIETYPTDVLDEDTRNLILEPLVKVVLDQEKPLLDVIGLLKDLPEDDIINHMITELEILKVLYETDLAEVQEKIANNTGDFVLTEATLSGIRGEVKRIRTDIVEFK